MIDNKNDLSAGKISRRAFLAGGAVIGAGLTLEGCAAHSFRESSRTDGATTYQGSRGLGSATVYISTSNDLIVRRAGGGFLMMVPELEYVGRKSTFAEGEKVAVTILPDGYRPICSLRYELMRDGQTIQRQNNDTGVLWATFPYENLPKGDYTAVFHDSNEFLGKADFRVLGK